jgi:putative ABC transport system permease protein
LVRRRATAVLRAVGITRGELARILACELGVVGVLAAAAAAVVGSVLGWVQVEVLLRGMLGMAVLYSYPRRVACWGGIAIIVLTAAVGWLLGQRAGRAPLGAALHCE